MNLIICTTPLQVLIAERIIDLHPEEKFQGLFLARNKNDKYRCYYCRLQKKCIKSDFFLLDNLPRRLYSLLLLKIKTIKSVKFDTIFIASIDGFFNHTVLSFLDFNVLNTFDDGLANITEDGLYSIQKKERLALRALRAIFSIKYDMCYLKNNTTKHYTIYQNEKNITSKLTYISLMNLTSKPVKTQTIKIFVGQPLIEIGIAEQKLLNIFKQYNIDYYFPHPREKDKISGLKYIDTEKIFEDYMLDILIREYSEIEIYTFFSSVILNLKDIQQIKIVAFFSKDIPAQFTKAYHLFQGRNIECIDIGGEPNV